MSDSNPQLPHETPLTDSTTEVSLEEFLDDPDLIRSCQAQSSQAAPVPEAPESLSPPSFNNSSAEETPAAPPADDEEEYLHLDIDFDDDPYELPPDIDMTTPLGRSAQPAEPPPLAPRNGADDDLGFTVEEFSGKKSEDDY